LAALSDYIERRLPFLDASAFDDVKTFSNREHLLQTLYSTQAIKWEFVQCSQSPSDPSLTTYPNDHAFPHDRMSLADPSLSGRLTYHGFRIDLQADGDVILSMTSEWRYTVVRRMEDPALGPFELSR
jgi:hypothetical protein